MSRTADATGLGMRGSGRSLKKALRVLVMVVSHSPRAAMSMLISAWLGREGEGEIIVVHEIDTRNKRPRGLWRSSQDAM